MAIFRANTQQDGYCYQCREDVAPEKLKQCVRCKNWFCENHISSVQNPESIPDELVDLCDKHQGRPSLF